MPKNKRKYKKWSNTVVSNMELAGQRYWLKDKKNVVHFQNGRFHVNDQPVSRITARDTIMEGCYGYKGAKRSILSDLK